MHWHNERPLGDRYMLCKSNRLKHVFEGTGEQKLNCMLVLCFAESNRFLQNVRSTWNIKKKKAVGLLWLGALTPVVYNGLFQRFPHLSQQLKQYFIKLMTSEPQWYKRLLPPVCGCVSVSEKLLNAERREWQDFYTHFPS